MEPGDTGDCQVVRWPSLWWVSQSSSDDVCIDFLIFIESLPIDYSLLSWYSASPHYTEPGQRPGLLSIDQAVSR